MWMEIFKTGTWKAANGISYTFTDSDLIAMKEAFFETKDDLKPVARLGSHNEGLAPAVGRVVNMKHEPGSLFAELEQVPDIVKTAIQKGLYKAVSGGIWREWEHKGKVYDRVVNHVAILGSSLPAIKGLKDLEVYLSSGENLKEHCFSFPKNKTSEEIELENKELKMNKEELNAKQNELDEANKKIAEFESKEDERKAESEKANQAELKKQKDDSDKTIAEQEKKIAEFEHEAIEKACSVVIEKAVNDGVLLPKHKDNAKAIALKLCAEEYSEDETNLWESYQEILFGKSVDFSEKSSAGGEDEAGANSFEDDLAEGRKIVKGTKE